MNKHQNKPITSIQEKALFELTVVCFLFLGQACSTTKPTSRIDDLPPTTNLLVDPNRKPIRPTEKPATVSVSQILCSYRGAVDVRRDIERTREQALRRAQHLLLLARAQDTNFEDLAQRYSDDSKSSMNGGDIGTVNPGELHPDLESAAFGMGIEQISDVVESPKGFHILLRHAPKEAQAAEVLISYQGAKRYTARQPRTRKEAQTLADEILERLHKGSSFQEEALAHSDLPNHVQGGFYRAFQKNSRHPKFEEIVWSLQIDQLSEVVETDTGFHIVKRLPVRRIQVRKILIQFRTNLQDEAFISEGKVRTKTEAYRLAEQIHRLAIQPNSDFATLAVHFSEGPEKDRLGLVDPFGRGQIDYNIERTAFALKSGQISEVVECKGGYAIIKRIR